MPHGWKEYSLGDLIEIKHGFAFSGEYFKDDPQGDILLTPGNFSIAGGFKDDKFKYYVGPVPQEFVLDERDLLITMTDLSKEADTLGYPAIISKPSCGRFLHNQRLGKVLIKNGARLNKGFLYQLLKTNDYRHEVLASATGTTVKHTSPNRILAFKFKLPPPYEQQAIAHILGTLDDKIELNRRMNETLEAMARALFKSWFVDFDPVRAKAEGRQPEGMDADTAALFPDSFEDSALGEIPKGWRVGNIGDLASNRRIGVDPSQLRPGTPYIGLEHMPRKSIALFEWGQADGVASNKFRFSGGDLLFGKLRPYFHKVGVAPLDGVCSTDILVIFPKKPHHFALALAHVSSEELIQYVDAASTGTKMPRTNWKDIAHYEIVIPGENVMKKLDDEIRPMIDSIKANIHESRTLAAIRDALFPKLLSGEVRVEDTKKWGTSYG